MLALSDDHGDGWHPGGAEDRVAEHGHGVQAVFDRGGDVAADGQPVFGGCARLEPPGDLLDRFPWPEIAFREIIGEGNSQVTGVTQNVVLAVAEDFHQAPPGVLPGAAPGAGPAGDLGQADPDRAPQVQGVLVQDRGGDVTGAAGAGGVRGVVQREQGAAGLGGPVRARVVLSRAVQIPDQVRSAELVADPAGAWRS